MRTCTRCNQEKPESEFYVRETKCCKICARARKNERYASNYNGYQDKERARYLENREEKIYYQFVYRLKRVFKMTVEQYQAMVEVQDGKCAICRRVETKLSNYGKVLRLAVDHDHNCCPTSPTCGDCVRGLLCARCNIILGHMEKEPGLESKMIAYLLQNQTAA